ncbi:MAG: nucleotide exchange factor GrpE [Nanoarchaeota archaeon]|nr:nucleotide exchange factor GrpE [Nanoarchaeota archaeon]
MVFSKISQALNRNDEKYEILLHKYSSLKLQNKNLVQKQESQREEHEFKMAQKFAKEILTIFEHYEKAKEQSFKVNATSSELQRFLLDFNTIGKQLDTAMKQNGIEVYDAKERFYDSDLHELGSYQESKGMQKGIILKTTRKGYKFKNRTIKKPRVVVTN